MMDKERVETLLAALEDYAKELDKMMGTSPEEYKNNSYEQRATERLLQLISEVELDIIKEIYKGLELKLSENERSMVLSLEKTLGKGIVSEIIIRRNLRNQLVHAYKSYKPEEVFKQAHNRNDIAEFMKKVRKILK